MTGHHVEAPVSTEEFMEVQKALAASEAQIKHLQQAKIDLERKVSGSGGMFCLLKRFTVIVLSIV